MPDVVNCTRLRLPPLAVGAPLPPSPAAFLASLSGPNPRPEPLLLSQTSEIILGNLRQQWREYDYVLLPFSFNGTFIARKVRAMAEERELHRLGSLPTEGPEAAQSLINGKVVQSSVEKRDVLDRETRRRFRHTVLNLLRQVEPESAELNYHWSGMQVLIAPPGHGKQPIHFDSTRWESGTHRNHIITALLFCSDCNSSLLPRYPGGIFTSQLKTESPHATHCVELLSNPHAFHSVPVEEGALLLFRHSVAHAGVACATGAPNRIVLFDELSPNKKAFERDSQYNVWNFSHDVDGKRSERYRRLLLANWHYSPVVRLRDKEVRKQHWEWLKELGDIVCRNKEKEQYSLA